ncbi:MAG: Cgl0159 family (beta/alpha)8-fold protein [Acidimicrobiales bacterium]
MTGPTSTRRPLGLPALVLAADHRARGVLTTERYADYLHALTEALPHCEGILASAQPLGDLARVGALRPEHHTYLSLNRTGLAGSAFELDDRLVASVGRAAADGWTGVKLMTRIALDDPYGAGALELLGQVLEEARSAGLEALIEPILWRGGAMSKETADVVLAAVIAHDLGAPLLKVPVPDAPAGAGRVEAVNRVVEAVGVPVLFLGGPRLDEAGDRVPAEARDVMAGGGAGLAIGRTVLQEPSPAGMASKLAGIVHAT